jgi:Asp-tRNA(Asn)/Glu-tRNA(Gln) amidotransferase B subunit
MPVGCTDFVRFGTVGVDFSATKVSLKCWLGLIAGLKASGGKANPQAVNDFLKAKLGI